jgi:presenilin 1
MSDEKGADSPKIEQPSSNEGNGSNVNNETIEESKLDNYLFCFASFHAVFAPVCITMILSALAVIHLNTDATREAGAQAYSQAYEVFNLEENNTSQNLFASIGNTLIMIAVICVMTFVVVLLYKYKCMKLFYAYMVMVTILLLGYFSYSMFLIAIEKYNLRVDWFSLVFIFYNFAIVGTLSIFYGRGMPAWIGKGYLILSSVILAWQLSFFGTWTAWTLLVALAIWDLFAVLSPCGPLRKLAELMNQPDAPTIPGLLYEANLPEGTERPNTSRGMKKKNAKNSTRVPPVPFKAQSQTTTSLHKERDDESLHQEEKIEEGDETKTSDFSKGEERASPSIQPSSSRTGAVPLALAIVYKLQIIDEKEILKPRTKKKLFYKNKRDYKHQNDSNEVMEYSGLELRQRQDQLAPHQLKSVVKVIFPSRGGRIELVNNEYWTVFSKSGSVLREFYLDDKGRVYQKGAVRKNKSKTPKDNTIKLGLGDFIFYSVLVSKAALYGFASFAVCFLVILAGLGLTLLLLSVYGKALPALPISILFGVAFFFLSMAVVDPWIQSMIRLPLYV